MIQYGLISRIDSDTLEKTFDLIANEFPDETINYTEVGIYNGRSVNGVKEYLESKGLKYQLNGIENFKDKEQLVFLPEETNLIQGSSIEVYNQLEDNSQHLILIDGNHSFPYVIADFFCYSQKVKVGGYIAFHDAAPQAQFKSWQRMGSESDPDMYISVRKALEKIGLLEDGYVWDEINKGMYGYGKLPISNSRWELVFDEYDKTHEGGGLIVLKKIL